MNIITVIFLRLSKIAYTKFSAVPTDAAIDAMVQELTAAVENLERKPAPSRPSTTSKYTLRFVTNGGSALEPITAIKGTTIKLKDYVTTREGYTFAGWYADAALTERLTEVTLNASTSIYAKWTVFCQVKIPGIATKIPW